ncbi:MAG: LysM peptidoglycan-binding domain-containing protein, partial [Bacteroidota bacterium]
TRVFIPYLFLFAFFLTQNMDLLAQCNVTPTKGVHVVQERETLFSISRKYSVSVDDICTWNSINKEKPLLPCQQLVVSAALASPAPVAYSSVFTPRGVSTANENSNQSIQKQPGKWHTVRAGETTAALARLYGYTEDRFREFNNLSAKQVIQPGAVLRSSECDCGDVMTPTPVTSSPTSVSTYGNTPTTYGYRPFNLPNSTSTNSARSYMTADESQMIDEINLMRSNPAGYIQYVRQYAQTARTWNRQQFTFAVNSLIRDLENTPNLSNLQPHPCLYRVAQRQGDHISSLGQLTHVGPNGKQNWSRTTEACPDVQMGITKTGSGNFIVGNENLSAGLQDPRAAVINLLIDAGLSDPLHRKTLLAPEWRFVGCYNFPAGQMPAGYVQLFGR